MIRTIITAVFDIVIFGTWIFCGIWYISAFRKSYLPYMDKNGTRKLNIFLGVQAMLILACIICSVVMVFFSTEGLRFGIWLADAVTIALFCIMLFSGVRYFDSIIKTEHCLSENA